MASLDPRGVPRLPYPGRRNCPVNAARAARRCGAQRPVLRPLEPVPAATRAALGVGFFVLFVALWALATFGGFVSRTFLADPVTMVREGYSLLVDFGFSYDIGMTVWRVVGGFVMAAPGARPPRDAVGAGEPGGGL